MLDIELGARPLHFLIYGIHPSFLASVVAPNSVLWYFRLERLQIGP